MTRYSSIILSVTLVLTSFVSLAAFAVNAQPTTKPARDGQAVYGRYCAACHGRGMRGAPKLTDASAWAPRLEQDKATLYAHSIQGIGWMPTRGGCSTCTDEEIKAAVDYLLTIVARPTPVPAEPIRAPQ